MTVRLTREGPGAYNVTVAGRRYWISRYSATTPLWDVDVEDAVTGDHLGSFEERTLAGVRSTIALGIY